MKKLIFRIERLLEEFYAGRWRAGLLRAQREREDLFMLLVYSESLGIPNPVSWYTLELRGVMLERFHEWHRRMGMEKSPLDDIRCC